MKAMARDNKIKKAMRLFQYTDLESHKKAIHQLIRLRAVDELISVLNHPHKDIRAAVADGFKYLLQDPRTIRGLTIAIDDEEAGVRFTAMNSLLRSLGYEKDRKGNPRFIGLLTKALEDRDRSVRQCAVNYLGLIDDPRVIPLLTKATQDEDSNVRSSANMHLKEIKKRAPQRKIGKFHESNKCDLCGSPAVEGSSLLLSASQMGNIVKQGFNPFDKPFCEMRVEIQKSIELGAAFGLDKNQTYQQWADSVFQDTSDWMLCKECGQVLNRIYPDIFT